MHVKHYWMGRIGAPVREKYTTVENNKYDYIYVAVKGKATETVY